MTASERDALEQGIRMALSHASERKMTAAMLEVYQPADAHDARVESEAWAALAAVALRELERAGGRDALWREYEAARDKVIDHASLWGAGAAEKAPPLLDALDAAVRALAAGDGQDSRAWRPVDPNNLPEPQWMLVTNNIDARDARGDMSHLWLVYMLHAPSLDEPQYGVTAFSGNRRICYITHWRPAIPEGADRMIVAATDPEGA